MTPGALVISLRGRGVTLTVEAGRLRYRAPAGVLTDTELTMLREHKRAILEVLAGSCQACGSWLYHDESIAAGLCLMCRRRSEVTEGNVA